MPESCPYCTGDLNADVPLAGGRRGYSCPGCDRAWTADELEEAREVLHAA